MIHKTCSSVKKKNKTLIERIRGFIYTYLPSQPNAQTTLRTCYESWVLSDDDDDDEHPTDLQPHTITHMSHIKAKGKLESFKHLIPFYHDPLAFVDRRKKIKATTPSVNTILPFLTADREILFLTLLLTYLHYQKPRLRSPNQTPTRTYWITTDHKVIPHS